MNVPSGQDNRCGQHSQVMQSSTGCPACPARTLDAKCSGHAGTCLARARVGINSASCLLPHCASSAPAWCSGPPDVQIYAGRPACCCTVQGMHMLHQQLQKSCHPEEGCRTPCLWSCLVQGGRISSALATQGNLRPRQVHCLCRTCLLLALRRCRCSSSTLSASSVLVAGLQGYHCEQAYRRRGGAKAHWGKCTLGHVGHPTAAAMSTMRCVRCGLLRDGITCAEGATVLSHSPCPNPKEVHEPLRDSMCSVQQVHSQLRGDVGSNGDAQPTSEPAALMSPTGGSLGINSIICTCSIQHADSGKQKLVHRASNTNKKRQRLIRASSAVC